MMFQCLGWTVLNICDLFWNLYVVVNYFIFRIISKGTEERKHPDEFCLVAVSFFLACSLSG